MATSGSGPPPQRYTVREVSEMLGISRRQIRSFIADGALDPSKDERGRYLFAFTDLVVLRAVSELIDEGVPTRRIHAAIRELRAQLPADTSLAEATLDISGRSLVVRLDEDVWEPESGQRVFDFDVAGVAEQASDVVEARTLVAPEAATADAWYVYADEVESVDPVAAEAAYRKALDADPGHADAHLNLGRLLHTAGAVREALAEYRAALEVDDEDATTWFNIGVASQDLGEYDDAIRSYERALELAPRFADPRFNLATLYEERGDVAKAVQHLREYRDLVSGG